MISREDFGIAVTLPPDQAVEYLTGKGYVITSRWNELERFAYNRSFTVAGVLKADILTMLRDSLVDNLAKGETSRDWVKSVREKLANYGLVNGEIETGSTNRNGEGATNKVKFSPHRLDTIYRTNLQSAFNGGRLSKQLDLVKTRGYFVFNSVQDDRRSNECTKLARLLAGKAVPHTHPILKTAYTPNHFKCRSSWSSLSAFAVDKRGLKVYEGELDWEAAPGFDKTPLDTYEPDTSTYTKAMRNKYGDFLISRRDELDEKLRARGKIK